MTNLEMLYAEQRQIKKQQPTSTASAMSRHQKLAKVQREIEYYELGDTISRTEIQEELEEIKGLQKEIDRLTWIVREKRENLVTNVFGDQEIIS